MEHMKLENFILYMREKRISEVTDNLYILWINNVFANYNIYIRIVRGKSYVRIDNIIK